jgi:hypothetical protein
MMKVDLKDGIIQIYASELVQDEAIAAELSKHAVYEEALLTCFAQLAVSGEVDWNDGESPWRSYWTGKGETFEKLRQIIATQADPVAAKMVADLTKERDGLYAQKEKLKAEVWQLQAKLRDAENQVRRV